MNKKKNFFKFNFHKKGTVLFIKNIKYMLIFFLIIFTYLLLPKFFDYNKKINFINSALQIDYNLRIKKFEDISYKLLPTPRLFIKNTNLEFKKGLADAYAQDLVILVKLHQIYKKENLTLKKIKINNSELIINAQNIKKFLFYIKNLNNKIFISNSDVTFTEKEKKIITFKRSKFNNSNNKKLAFKSYLFDQKIIINFYDNENNLKLKADMSETGSKLEINFPATKNKKDNIGSGKILILNNKFQFNFKNKDKLEFFDSILITDILKTDFNGTLSLIPNFNFKTVFNIKNFNFKKLNKYLDRNINKFNIKMFSPNKKLNGQFTILFDENDHKNKLIKKANIPIVLENGELIIKNSKIETLNESIKFTAVFKNNKGYQTVSFNILFKIKDSKKLIQKLKLSTKNEVDLNSLYIAGSLNISSNKINIQDIIINNSKNIDSEKINFYEDTFEKQILENNFFNIFLLNKIENFINIVS